MRRCAVIVVGGLVACSSPGPLPRDYGPRELRASEDPDLTKRAAAALALLRNGDLEGARTRAESVLVLDKGAGPVRAVLARCLAEDARRKDPEDLALMERAEGELLLARRTHPKHPLVLLLHAEFLELDGQVTLAADVLDELLAAHPRNREGLRNASRLRFELGQERRAVPLLQSLLDLEPENADAVYRLAHCRVRLAEAIERKDTAEVRIEPEAARDAFLLAAQMFVRYQSLQSADIAGYLGEAHARAAAARVAPQGSAVDVPAERRKVLSILATAAQKSSDHPGPHHSRGVVLEELGETAAARKAYEAALTRQPKYVPSLLNLARLLDASGDPKNARLYCLRALELDLTKTERDRLLEYVRK